MYAAGTAIADRYRLDARLATGGMGDVWSARDTLLDRQVAIKLVKPEFADDPSFRQRLVAEARAAAAVNDPHVVQIYDVGDVIAEDGRHGSYIAMALIDGRPLNDIIAAGPLPAADAVDVMAQVATAIAASHARGVIHRDIKPANLMRDAGGRVTVLDFGIARAADAAALTATGQLVGTARYMSPEQVSGQPATAASDIYSLGVVAYECLAGAPPFAGGSDIAVALAHRDQPPPPLPDAVPAGLASLVESCLAKDPAARPTAPQIIGLLATYDGAATAATAGPTAVMPVPAPATQPLPTAAASGIPRWLEWRRVAGVAAGLAAVVLVAVLIGVFSDGSPPATASGRHHGRSTSPPTPATVTVLARRYLGERYSVAAAQLSHRGLTPIATGSAVSPEARVIGVSPHGAVTPGTPITLSLSAPTSVASVKPAAPAKRPAPKRPAPKPVKPVKVPPGHAKHDKGKPGPKDG